MGLDVANAAIEATNELLKNVSGTWSLQTILLLRLARPPWDRHACAPAVSERPCPRFAVDNNRGGLPGAGSMALAHVLCVLTETLHHETGE